MDKFFGSAILEFAGKKEVVSLCLNLSNNVIEARFPMMDVKESFKRSNWMTQNVRLSDIEIKLPHGRLRKNIYEDFFVQNYKPGMMSIHDSTLSRAMNLRGEESGITTLIITPRSSGIEFNFDRASGDISEYELFYTDNIIFVRPMKIDFNSASMIINGDKSGLSLSSESSIKEVREKFWLSWSIIQGTPINLRAILDGNCLTLNLSFGTHTSGLGALVNKEEDALLILQCFNNFLESMNESEFSRWRTATHFYMDGVATNRFLEIRVISLFTFLEIIDSSRTLNKTALSDILGIKNDEADMLVNIRNFLIHEGESLKNAVTKAQQKLGSLKNNIDLNTFYDVYQTTNHSNMSALFYFTLAACIARFWAKKVGYTGVVYQYEETINDLKARSQILQ